MWTEECRQLSDVVIVRCDERDGQSDQLMQVRSLYYTPSHTVQRLKHVNIAQYLGCYIDMSSDTYLVSSYVQGTKLSQWIELGDYTEETANVM